MQKPLADRSASDLLPLLLKGAITAEQLSAACLDRIEALEPELQAWAFIDPERVLVAARAADARRVGGSALGPLHGLPVGVKDTFDTADMPTEFGTPVHHNRRPPADATMVRRLREAGAIVFGKTVTSEYAVYTAGPTRNPRDLARTPGGSSSGSAAAVAAGMVPLALATQTNGSTIRPASFCGVVGYKPSLGLLPRTGILKQSDLLDQPGLMARNVGDVALLTDALAGADPEDGRTLDHPAVRLVDAAGPSERTPRFAFVRGPSWDRVDEEARNRLEAFVAELGGGVEEVRLPPAFDDAASIHSTIMGADIAKAYRADYERAKDQMSRTLVGIIEAGARVPATALSSAVEARDRLLGLHAGIAAPYDVLITPATRGVAPRREEGTGDPIMATLWTLLGLPALTLPLLVDRQGLPLGVQLVGSPLGDEGLIAAAAWLERRNASHHSDIAVY